MAQERQIPRPADTPTTTPSPTEPSPTPTTAVISDETVIPKASDGSQMADTPTPTPTSSPSPTPTPSPSPTPTPALRQLTTDGCCTQPFWSPDSRQVLFIDKPAPDTPVGIWGVDTTQPNPRPELVTERIAFYTEDLTYRLELDQDTTVIEQLAGPLTETNSSAETVTARWTVPANGRPVSISPGRTHIAWQVSDEDLPFERRTTQVWVANLDGTDALLLTTLPRGGLSGWVSDDVLLLSGRESLESREQVFYTLSLTSGRTVELARGERIRGWLMSPDRTWLAYFAAQDEDPEQNGLWLVRADGSERRKLDRELFGAYQWRDARRLLIIPFRPEATYHELWELDVEAGEARRLTDPEAVPFKIANGDWSLSPDGRQVAFVASQDRNIWLLTLGD
jgi:Tol biopolymer transport system component